MSAFGPTPYPLSAGVLCEWPQRDGMVCNRIYVREEADTRLFEGERVTRRE